MNTVERSAFCPPQFDNHDFTCHNHSVRQGSTRVGTPKVSAKTGKSFAGTDSLYPEMAEIVPDPQNKNPMSKNLCISEQGLIPFLKDIRYIRAILNDGRATLLRRFQARRRSSAALPTYRFSSAIGITRFAE